MQLHVLQDIIAVSACESNILARVVTERQLDINVGHLKEAIVRLVAGISIQSFHACLLFWSDQHSTPSSAVSFNSNHTPSIYYGHLAASGLGESNSLQVEGVGTLEHFDIPIGLA